MLANLRYLRVSQLPMTPDPDLTYEFVKPDLPLRDFVDSFWQLQNRSAQEKEMIVLPDGRIDLIMRLSPSEPPQTVLLGIGTGPERTRLPGNTTLYAISFKLPATEYILRSPVAHLLNSASILPAGFWGLDACSGFEDFCQQATRSIRSLLPTDADSRKRKLFEGIYASNGAQSVQALSQACFWSSRQINRYFNEQFGLSLKAYCSILRFRASFQHISEGKLFPEQNFADQSHFIKEVKKRSGVSPKELSKNVNGRFIQFSTLGPK